TRTDTRKLYRAGGYSTHSKRLKTITTEVDETIVSHYTLGYQLPPYRKSLLNSLTQCFGVGTSNCLPATQMTVTDFPASAHKEGRRTLAHTFVSHNGHQFDADLSTSQDFDGDGRNDVRLDNSKIYLSSLATQTIPHATISGLYNNAIVRVNGEQLMHHARVINQQMDFNLDGKADMVGFNDESQRDGAVLFAWYNGSEMKTTTQTDISFNCAGSFTRTVWTDPTNGLSGTEIAQRDCSVYVLDINRDGKMDLLVGNLDDNKPQESKYDVYLNTHDGSNAARGTPSFLKIDGATFTSEGFVENGVGDNGFDDAMQIIDIDGDGYDNLVGFYRHTPRQDSTNTGEAHTQYAFEPVFTDDSNVDLATPSSLHNNLTFTAISGFRTLKDKNIVASQYPDINQDGLPDYLYLENLSYGDASSSRWRLQLNNGIGYEAVILLDNVVSIDSEGVVTFENASGVEMGLLPYTQVIDYDRDGITDLVVPEAVESPGICVGGKVCPRSNIKHAEPDVDLFGWMWFKGQADGTFEKQGSLNLFAPLNDLNFMDYDGDGYLDAVTREGRNLGHYKLPGYDADGGNLEDPGVYYYPSEYAEIDLVIQIENGLGHQTQFCYDTLSDPAEDADGRTLYSNDFPNSVFPYVNFTTTDTVVKSMRVSNGLGSGTAGTTASCFDRGSTISDNNAFNTTRFFYTAARFHKQGRGFQGYGVIEEVNERAGITTKTQYSQTFPYSGMVEKQWTAVTGHNPATHYLSMSENSGFNDAQSGVTAITDQPLIVPYAKYSHSISRELGDATTAGTVKSTSHTRKTVNNIGLPTETIALICDGTITGALTDSASCPTTSPWQRQTTTETLYDTEGVVNKPQDITTTASVTWAQTLGASKIDLKVNKVIVYNDDWTVKTITTTDETTPSGDYESAPGILQTFTYYANDATTDAKGQLETVTTSSANAPTGQDIQGIRSGKNHYSADGYFVKSTRNNLWDATADKSQTTYKAATGQVDSQTDVYGNTVISDYDNFHRLKKVTAPGTPDAVTATNRCDTVSSDPCKTTYGLVEVYRTVIQQAGSPSVYKYMDNMGRLLRTKSFDFDGIAIESTTEYDAEGLVIGQYSPAGQVTFEGFDALKRPTLKKVDYAPQKYHVGYEYNGLTTKMTITPKGGESTTSARIISRTTNSEGKLVTSEDEASNLTQYRYNAAGLPTVIEGPSESAGAAGIRTTAMYNALGHKTSIFDPNQGATVFKYNALGELRSQTDARSITTVFNYDPLGRTIERKAGADSSSKWLFDTLKLGALTNEFIEDGSFSKSYQYDNLGRMTQTTTNINDNIGNHSFQQDFVFDSKFGRLTGMRQPDGTATYFKYKDTGFPEFEYDSTDANATAIRSIEGMDHNGLLTKVGYRNDLETTTSRTTSGAITAICTTLVNRQCGESVFNQVQYITYEQYDSFGNIRLRQNHTQDIHEIFEYDNRDRITSAEKKGIVGGYSYRHETGSTNQSATLELTTHYGYNNAGNMNYKSDFSLYDQTAYTYGTSSDSAGPNAVKSVKLASYGLFSEIDFDLTGYTMEYNYDLSGNVLNNMLTAPNGTSTPFRQLRYNADNKPVSITNYKGQVTEFDYGSGGMRYRQVKDKDNDGLDKIYTYYVGGGSYEKTFDAGLNQTQTSAYIGDYAVMNRCSGNGSTTENNGLKYLHKDRLGSVDSITNADVRATWYILPAMALEQRSYGAFGKARTSTGGVSTGGDISSSITSRGYTGHEHLDQSGLIHMNGRAYDPSLGRFLSVDPIVSMPDNGQSLNPYSYVMNNPLKYTDPSGYSIHGGCGPNVPPSACLNASGGTTPTAGEGSESGLGNGAKPATAKSGANDVASTNSQTASIEYFDFTSGSGAYEPLPRLADGNIFGSSGGNSYPEENRMSDYANAMANSPEGLSLSDLALDVLVAMAPFGEAASMAIQGDIAGAVRSAATEGVMMAAGVVSGGLAYGIYKSTKMKRVAELAAKASERIRGKATRVKAIYKSEKNGAGGDVFTTDMSTVGSDFEGIVSSAVMQYKKVDILTGTHGSRTGKMTPDIGFYLEDIERYSGYPGVTIHNMPDLSSSQLSKIVNESDGVVIGGFCHSSFCL
ncbi:MAG: VCBS repeat-containing protein, partial [Algicola sp.]|nr:VCBS repeat-containing protein [Algicola sp.]